MPAACTVKLVEAGGVALVVVSVRVEVWLTPMLVTELGAKEAVVPVGKTVVTLRFAWHEALFPLKPIVTVYTALVPGATGFGDCVPTATVFGFESVNVFCAADWLPTAVT